MIKLDKICSRLNEIKERLEEKVEDIYCRADNRDRDLTDYEQERVDEMSGEIDAIDNALDYLKDYCDEY